VLATTQQAQLAAGRAALLPSSGGTHMTLPQLYAVYQRTHLAIFADSLSNVFLLTTVTTLIAAFIGLLLRSGPSHHDSGAAPLVD